MGSGALFPAGKRMSRMLLTALLLSLVIGLFVDAHPHFGIEAVPGFYAWFPMFASLGLIAVARALAALLGPREDDDGR